MQENQTLPTTEEEKPLKNLIFLGLFVIGLFYALFAYPQQSRNIAIILVGFSTIIFIHELGHFAAAKSVGIMVEAFSIGFGPVIFGIKKVKEGFQVRVLPDLVPGKNGKGVLGFTINAAVAKEGETEYRVSLIPFGGFVAMLGQSDTGADVVTDDPRSFGNKKVWQRAIVIAAGVTMNLISGIIAFMIVFNHGVELPPAVVGYVIDDSPAAQAGMQHGDEILSIDGQDGISFMDLIVAGAFADAGESVQFEVKHLDGDIETLDVTPSEKFINAAGLKGFGIQKPSTLTIGDVPEGEMLSNLQAVGFEPKDEIVAVNGKAISHYFELADHLSYKITENPEKTLTLTVKRTDENGQVSEHDTTLSMALIPITTDDDQDILLGMSPRLKIQNVLPGSAAEESGIQQDDIVLRVGTISNPTHHEFTQQINAAEGKALAVTVGREVDGEFAKVDLSITPRYTKPSTWKVWKEGRYLIGVTLSPADLDSAVVAHASPYGIKNECDALTIPRGATITSINDQAINNWNDIRIALLANAGNDVTISYKSDMKSDAKSVTAAVPEGTDWAHMVWAATDNNQMFYPPLMPLKRVFKADTLGESLSMGWDQTYGFAAQTYMMIRGMMKGSIEAKSASGPVGILSMSYSIVAEREFVDYLYFMAIISICIAVFNFLPLPILDGGIMVLLLIEKIKGSPVSERVQIIINNFGFFLIIGFFLYVTYHDIAKLVN